jgi:hypothetical protein
MASEKKNGSRILTPLVMRQARVRESSGLIEKYCISD